MILFPKCKINIGLNILSRRPDSYHELSTIMVPVDWCDILELVPSRNGITTLTVTGRNVKCPPENNLVMKAWRKFNEASDGKAPLVDIYLRKVIPDGAGLGGGSSDAAYTLIGLNQLVETPFSDTLLESLAAEIGADCPFFIKSRPVIASGTGTDLSPIEIPQLEGKRIVIAKPPRSVSTAEAYSRVKCAKPEAHLAELIHLPIERWRGLIKNDFEPSVNSVIPDIEEIKRSFYMAGADFAAMSGSGSAVFGIFPADIMTESIDMPQEYIVWKS